MDQRETEDLKDVLRPATVRRLVRPPQGFYRARAVELAPHLLGLLLVHDTLEGLTAGRITEVEAYEGPEDRACHAFGGRRTRRTEVMFGPPGRAYIYFTYGMHWLFNIVAGPEGVPHAVLVRSIQPVTGMSLMVKRRGGAVPVTQGPARTTQAMGITGDDNGKDLYGCSLYVAVPPDGLNSPVDYQVTERIGVDYAGEARAYPWRFVEKGSLMAKGRLRQS